MNLSLRQIRAFVAIARLHSLTRAAEQLHITQAGLSSMLRDTESQLGCRLFDRTTRAVSLTMAGETFLPIATRALQDLEAGAAALSRISSAANTSLAIGATPLVASSLLPAACETFAGEFPGVTVHVHDLYRSDIQEGVHAGTLDAGYGVFLEASSGLKRTPICKAGLTLVYKPGSVEPAPGEKGLPWTALASARLIGLPIDNPIQKLVDRHLETIGRANEFRRTFQHLHTLLAMVEAGAGSALLPGFVAAAAQRYDVGLAPMCRPRAVFDFFEITHSGKARSPLVEAFGRQLKAAMAAFRC